MGINNNNNYKSKPLRSHSINQLTPHSTLTNSPSQLQQPSTCVSQPSPLPPSLLLQVLRTPARSALPHPLLLLSLLASALLSPVDRPSSPALSPAPHRSSLPSPAQPTPLSPPPVLVVLLSAVSWPLRPTLPPGLPCLLRSPA